EGILRPTSMGPATLVETPTNRARNKNSFLMPTSFLLPSLYHAGNSLQCPSLLCYTLRTMAKKDISKQAIALHKKLKGKINITPAMLVKDRATLSIIYTPGVAAVSSLIAKDKKLAREYTIKSKMIAVISDGSAVLG